VWILEKEAILENRKEVVNKEGFLLLILYTDDLMLGDR